ncbi:MFS transporter [Spirosoma spitsbergense]|uniref:MFS transporter n=1 Tax=Spirosoma spitsbergense TaxID=431554 RepID=UPI000380B6C6|nr:MFS transporter [Spirosoma spitsbergense]
MTQPPADSPNKPRGIWPLQALNFFMADIQAGIGPFLGIFLLAHGWKSGLIGSVMTIGGVAGMLMTAPAGALIDATKRKKTYVIVAALFTTLASGIILLSQNFWLVSVSQVATAIAGSAIGPGVVGITLGMVRQAGFNRQNGYNQAYNHAGNVAGAALSGYLGMRYGMPAVFILAALFGVLAIISVLLIPSEAIDDDAARGLPEKKNTGGTSDANGFQVLLKNKPLLLLAAALACFHLGNGAMLPLYGLAAASKNTGNATEFVAMTIIIAQLAMIVVSLLAMRMAEKSGFWLVMLISFMALPLRGFMAAYLTNQVGLYPVQILDGIGAGLQSVAVPGMVAHLLNGTGRVNVGQGAVMTVQGLGASLSPAIGGWMAQQIGYSTTFLILGSFALVSILLWLGFATILKSACDTTGSSALAPA